MKPKITQDTRILFALLMHYCTDWPKIGTLAELLITRIFSWVSVSRLPQQKKKVLVNLINQFSLTNVVMLGIAHEKKVKKSSEHTNPDKLQFEIVFSEFKCQATQTDLDMLEYITKKLLRNEEPSSHSEYVASMVGLEEVIILDLIKKLKLKNMVKAKGSPIKKAKPSKKKHKKKGGKKK